MAFDPIAEVSSLLVPLDGSDAAYHALALVCEISKRHKAKLYALHVIEVPRTRALEAELVREADRGEQILNRAEQIGKEREAAIEPALLKAREAGQAVVDEAAELSVDVVVVGVDYHHRPFGSFELGRLPRHVLTHAGGEVWLIRYSPPEGDLREHRDG